MWGEDMTKEVVTFIQGFRSDILDMVFNAISFLGEEFIYMLILAIVYYVIDKKKGEILAFSIFFTGIFNNTLKGIVNAPRPFEKFPSEIENLRPSTSTGTSFPSGHTQIFTAFWMTFYTQFKKKFVLIFAISLSLLMAISRIYLGVHFLEDVLTSILLGIGTAYIIMKYLGKLDYEKRLNIYMILCVLFFPFLFVIGSEDLFKSYGMFVGFVFALLFEHKYVNFKNHTNILQNGIRVIGGLVSMLVIQAGLGLLFDLWISSELSMFIFDMIRYGFISFIALGLYPSLFKKFNF